MNQEERVEIILGAGLGSFRIVANAFNGKHGTNIINDTVPKLIGKLKKTGTVTDQARCGRRHTVQPAMISTTEQLRYSQSLRGPTKSI